jgi:major membrane immunogen (membrane-anchored lipoprotein)
MKRLLSVFALAVLLTACGEAPQTLGAVSRDESPYQGTGKGFVAAGWKQGDKGAWESQLKARTQQGQNDYGRMN